MASTNVAHTGAHGASSPENLGVGVLNLKGIRPLIHPGQHHDLCSLSESANLTVRPWQMMAWLATQDGTFFHGISQDASSARLMAPTCEALEEFASRMHMVADLAAKAAKRVRLAGSAHGDAFNVWCEEDSTAVATGGGAHD